MYLLLGTWMPLYLLLMVSLGHNLSTLTCSQFIHYLYHFHDFVHIPSGRRESLPIAPTSLSRVPGNSVSSDLGSPDSIVTSPHPSSTVMILSDSTHFSEEENPEEEEVIMFDTHTTEGRMPNSSYKSEDTLFTWTDITGVYVYYIV